MGILLGEAISKKITEETRERVKRLKSLGINPSLLIIRVGDDAQDAFYENSAIRQMEKCKIASEKILLPENVSQRALEETIAMANSGNSNGILLFMPLPSHIDSKKIRTLISPSKDVDCINPLTHINIYEGSNNGLMPCTPRAVMEIIDYYNIPIETKRVTLIGRSLVVGKPLFHMLLNKNATVTLCHSKTLGLKNILSSSDIIISAVGRKGFIKGDNIKPNSYIIDVGINCDENGRLIGDVDYESCIGLTKNITPVPGGVGAVTTSILAKQIVEAATFQNKVGDKI